MMSIDTDSPLEKNKILIPDNYQLNFVEWCERFMKNTIVGFQKYPWEDRIEKAFFLGRPTGHDLNIFNNEEFPSPDEVKNIVLDRPEAWSRPWLARHGYYNQDILHAKILDLNLNDAVTHLSALKPQPLKV